MSKHSAQRLQQAAIAQHRAGAFLEAASLYRQALPRDRKLVPALMGLSDLEIQSGRIAQAVALLEQASKLKTNEPVIWVNLGEGLRRLGRYKT